MIQVKLNHKTQKFRVIKDGQTVGRVEEIGLQRIDGEVCHVGVNFNSDSLTKQPIEIAWTFLQVPIEAS